MSRISCDECSRADVLRAVAGRGLPSIEAGMPLPAGTGLRAAASSRARSGSRSSVYGARAPAALRRGHRRRRVHPGLADPRHRLPAGRGRCAVDALPGRRPALPEAAPAPRGRPAARAFAEDARLRWHPALAPLAQLHGEGKVSVLPAVGYDHPDQSHFTSRHFWEVGATDTSLLTGWIGRYLDAAGTRDNPLQGLSLTGQLQPTLATAKVPVAAIDGPDQYGFWAPGVWGEVEARMLDAIGTLGGVLVVGSGVPLGRERDAGRPTGCGASSSRSTARARSRRPVAYPASDDSFPKQLAGSRGDGRRGSAVALRRARGDRRVRHSRVQASALAPALTTTAASLYAFQRDLEARGVADRVLTLVWSGVRPAREGERLRRHRPRRGRHGVPDRLARSGHQVGEFPGLATGLDATGT